MPEIWETVPGIPHLRTQVIDWNDGPLSFIGIGDDDSYWIGAWDHTNSIPRSEIFHYCRVTADQAEIAKNAENDVWFQILRDSPEVWRVQVGPLMTGPLVQSQKLTEDEMEVFRNDQYDD